MSVESAVVNDVVSAMKARRVRRGAACVRLNVQVKSVAPMMDVVASLQMGPNIQQTATA